MNTQKKRFVVYLLFIFCGLLAAFLFLRKGSSVSTSVPTETSAKKDSLVTISLLSENISLENNNENFVSNEKAASGKNSCKLSPQIEYGVSLIKTLKDVPSFNNLKNISVTFSVLFEKENPDALYVLSIEDSKGKNVFWAGQPIVFSKNVTWTEAQVAFAIPSEFLNGENKIVVYPWNRNKKTFYVDDITINFIGLGEYKDETTTPVSESNFFFDFETEQGLSNSDNVKEAIAHSGKRACDLSDGREYGPSITKKINSFGNDFPKIISISLWVYPLSDNPNLVLTAAVINSKNETIFWDGKSTENNSFPKNKWTKINAMYKLPTEKFQQEDILSIVPWNKGKTDVLIDDLEIVYGESAERRGETSKINPIAIYEKRFVSEKNKPPFKTIYFEKQEINNGDNTSIIPQTKKSEGCHFSPEDEFIVGDFYPDKNGLDEILSLGPRGDKGLFVYSPEEKQFKKLWGTPLVADSIWNSNNTFFSGDFNSDGKLDILVVNKLNNDWGLIHFSGKEWMTISKGNGPKKEWVTKKNSDNIYPGNYFGNKQTILKLNNEWRFDLKLMDGDNILGNVDFKGYANDHNPKYYEFVKLVPGNFLSKNQTSLLVIMCNCADPNFDGKYCKQTEELPFLPNSVQIYSIPQGGLLADKRR